MSEIKCMHFEYLLRNIFEKKKTIKNFLRQYKLYLHKKFLNVFFSKIFLNKYSKCIHFISDIRNMIGYRLYIC